MKEKLSLLIEWAIVFGLFGLSFLHQGFSNLFLAVSLYLGYVGLMPLIRKGSMVSMYAMGAVNSDNQVKFLKARILDHKIEIPLLGIVFCASIFVGYWIPAVCIGLCLSSYLGRKLQLNMLLLSAEQNGGELKVEMKHLLPPSPTEYKDTSIGFGFATGVETKKTEETTGEENV
jgi:hypothetical protein